MSDKWSPWSWLKHEDNKSSVNLENESESPVSHLRHELDKLFDNTFSGVSLENGGGEEGNGFNPNLDIQESDSQYKIAVEVPGIDERDLEVHVEGDLLTIKGETHQKPESDKDNFQQVEQRHDSFCQVLNLPDNAEQESISATFNKGVLTLMINKRKEFRLSSRQIEINKE